MTLLERFRRDLSLRNITIYAQWIGVCSGILALIVDIKAGSDDLKAGIHRGSTVGILIWMAFWRIAHSVSFLCTPLVLETPQIFRFLFCCVWFPIVLPWPLTIFSSWRQRLMSTLAHAISYAFYAWGLSIWCGHPRYQRFPISYNRSSSGAIRSITYISLPVAQVNLPSAVAYFVSILYFIAWFRRHKYVFSSFLGGSGVEPMQLEIPGRSGVYETINMEADVEEGRIRLS